MLSRKKYPLQPIMKPISSDIVENTWKKIGGMSLQKAPEMIQLMQKEQPFVLAYVMAAGGNTLNQDERELLLYLGIVVWKIMSQGDRPLTKITGNALDKTEERNMKMLDYLAIDGIKGYESMSVTDYFHQIQKEISSRPSCQSTSHFPMT